MNLYKKRMGEIKVEFGLKESLKNKLVMNRLTQAGHVERMTDEKLAKSRCQESAREKEARNTKTDMGDCIKSDLDKVAENGENE